MFNKFKFPVFLLSLTILVFSLGYVFSKTYLSPTKPKEVEARVVSIDPICMGKALAEYMNAVLAETGGLTKIRPLSPAFNLTHYISPQLFEEMLNNNANFAALWGFSGNTYSSLSDGTDPNGAFYWYSPWRERFASAAPGKKVLITETGDFELGIPGVNRPNIIADMEIEFVKFMNSYPPEVASLIYFNALNTNPDPNFDYAPLTEDEIKNITSSGMGRAGINSANIVGSSGNFGARVTGLGLKWSLEILTGPEHLDAAVAAVNDSTANTILRLCLAEGGCGFGTHENPQPLIDFLKALNSKVNKPVWVIIGPNEPENEVWVAPECAVVIETPKDFPIPCNETDSDEELHNLRPYGSNPCDGSINNLAMMCGNDLITKQEVFVDFPGAVDPNCTLVTEVPYEAVDDEDPLATALSGRWIQRDWKCDHKRSVDLTTGAYSLGSAYQGTVEVKIDLENSQFPIMGNTELVPNRNREEGLDFAQRMNNYVSWYLNGAMFSPFDPPVDYEQEGHKDVFNPDKTLDENLKTDVNNVINYSGPINKLLSWRNLVEERNTEADNADASFNFGAGLRHDQIAGCNYELSGGADFAPKTCWGGPSHNLSQEEKRLSTWKFDSENNSQAPEEDYIDILGENPLTPPYESFINYWKDIEEWRGKICGLVTIPLTSIKLFACIDDDSLANLAKSNIKGLLYHGIPLASTEDKKGILLTGIDHLQPTAEDGNGVSIVQIEILPDEIVTNPATATDKFFRNFTTLYFPHMISSTEMADTLQNTFAPFSEDPLDKINGEIVNFDEIFDNANRCEILDTRVNPGDKLYAGLERLDGNGNPINPAEGKIKAKVQYTAEFSCDYTEELDLAGFNQCLTVQICTENPITCASLGGTVIVNEEADPPEPGGPLNCDQDTIDLATGTSIDRTGWVTCQYKTVNDPDKVQFCFDENLSVNQCEKTVMTATNVNVGTPYAEKAWRQLVQSDMSIFKKIYPALSSESPVEKFEHIPGETFASYSSSALSGNATAPQTYAGDAQLQKPGSNARIYFPYIGGIQKYFLTGIQCALRPQEIGCPESVGELENPESVKHCVEVWVPEATATTLASTVATNLATQQTPSTSFAGWAAYYAGEFTASPNGTDPQNSKNLTSQHLFSVSPGCNSKRCYEHINDRVLSETCSGGLCLNPLLVTSIALNENGGLISFDTDASDAAHFGCDNFGTLGVDLTINDKLSCLINTFNTYQSEGKDDYEALKFGGGYGYSQGDGNSNLRKIMSIVSSGTYEGKCPGTFY